MVEINGTTITMTRGDTLLVNLIIRDKTGKNLYEPVEGDIIRFALKKGYDDKNCLILKEIPWDTGILQLDPEDTKYFPQPDSYVYDVQITLHDTGYVFTIIANAKFILKEEVE